jgi:hypothetical protein
MNIVTPTSEFEDEPEARASRLIGIAESIRSLLADVSDHELITLQGFLADVLTGRPLAPQAGPVLAGALEFINRKRKSGKYFHVGELRDALHEKGVNSKPKDAYNALAYLGRKGYVRQVEYGRYEILEINILS